MMGSFREDNFNTLNTSLDISQDLGFVTKGLSAKVLVNFKNWSNSYYNPFAISLLLSGTAR